MMPGEPWPTEKYGKKVRPYDGHCPVCGADADHFCRPGCTLVDLMDYRPHA